ncbi:MAG: bi-domain-containing oxidoreductase [Alphaproteobacteria bacterium]
MKQVLQSPRGKAPYLTDVPAPQCGAGEVLVATHASLISAGTEKMLIDFASKSMLGKAKERPDLAKKVLDKLKRDGLVPTLKSVWAQLEQPLPLGYSAAGTVLQVGDRAKGQFKVGDRVVVAGAGLANHAEVNAVPVNLVAPLPANVPFADGCYATLGAIALHGVRNGKLTLGDRVAVLGLGLVGQLAAQLAKLSGARVMGLDYAADRLSLAHELSCDETFNLKDDGVDAAIASFTNGRGFDAVLICAATDSQEPIQNAAKWARDKARVVLVGKVGTELPYADFMKKELEVVISRSYGAGRYDPNFEQRGQTYPVGYVPHTERDNLAEIANLLADGVLNVESLTTHSFDIAEAVQAYTLITDKVPCLGVVLNYPNSATKLSRRIAITPVHVAAGELGVACIGTGGFAASVLLPALKNTPDTKLTGVASKGGTSARAAADRFQFGYAASDVQEVWQDSSTHAVLIATRHDSHAALTCAALKAGKHVFVEKPLAMTEAELQDVEKAYATATKTSGKVLMVGYNRRFAPATQALMKILPYAGPRQILMRVNAGQLPSEHWTMDAREGGGRLIGEACHFLDFAYYLSGSQPVSLYATSGLGQDNYAVTMTFANGGTAQIFYTSEGDSAFSKERVEVYASGMVGVIDNFNEAYTMRGGRKRALTRANLLRGQNKGHAAGLQAFVAACRGQSAPIAAAELFLSARLPLLAAESIRTGQVVPVPTLP